MARENIVTYFAETDARNKRIPFGIKREDRSRHMYVIGKTGMGKSTLLENMAVQDIRNGEGFCFIDPHGKSADLLLEYVPQERIKDVLYLAPFDMEFPISFNVMEDVGPDKRHLVANGLMSAFKKIWVDAWSARMEYILNNILLALLEYPDSTLIGVNRMLADKEYRNKVVANITDPSVKAFWTEEYAKYTEKFAAEAAPAIQNKIGQFISNPLVRNIIGQPKSTFDIRKLMDERKILIINLSKGRMGESNANLLGSMLITKIYLAAMSRADLGEEEMKGVPHFYLYVDEFQNFANESFADILSEARKYKLDLAVAHQYIEQMSEEVRAAVFGNVGTMVTFRVGAYDAEVLEKEFAPQFTAEDLVNLGRYQLYLKLMIDGVSSSPFSATTIPPIKKPEKMYVREIMEMSRSTYARPRVDVEDEIRRWHTEKSASVAAQSGYGGRESAPGGGKGGDRENTRREGQARDLPPRVNTKESWHRDNQPAKPVQPKPVGQMPQQSQQPERLIRENNSPRAMDERVAKETELRKALSLDHLKPKEVPKNNVKNTQKNPSQQNMSALRDALLAVMKQPPQAEKPSQSIQKTENPSSKNPEPPKEPSKESPKKNPPKEVPEDVLNNLLKMDDK
ncbi:MAG: type IV secretion system DNA-binding domain-containing protein [Candidatus Pacebacteria bacterium]|nr:type IV secretion system DNA-binding domain-containing protein [Candidatus Paceibacterota bacterium]